MSKKTKLLLLIVSCFLLITGCWLYYDYHNKKFEVIFFDVGQGDAVLINLPGNNEILIDGGPDMTVLYKLGKYLPIYDRRIELVILTHPHADHLTGLIEVLQRYRVEKVMYTGVKYKSGIYDGFIKTLKHKNIKTLEVDNINLDENNILEVIYPWENLAGREAEDLNDSSIVVKLVIQNNNKFLFSGDIGVGVEKEISEKVGQENLEANVLKVAHQGAETSSSLEFVQAVKPTWAIISVGENDFGHPSLRVIRRLERIGARVLRTDELGDIKFGINKAGESELK